MQKKFIEIEEMDHVVGEIMVANNLTKNSKFGYASKRFLEKNYKPTYKRMQYEIEDARIQHCLVDEKTKEVRINPDRNSRGYYFDKKGLVEVIKAEREIRDKYEDVLVEVEPFFLKPENIPEKITEEEREILKGCLIE